MLAFLFTGLYKLMNTLSELKAGKLAGAKHLQLVEQLSEFPTVTRFLSASKEEVARVGCRFGEFGRELEIYHDFLKKRHHEYPRIPIERLLFHYEEEDFVDEYCERKKALYNVSLRGKNFDDWWFQFTVNMEEAGCTGILDDGYVWPTYYDDYVGNELHERKSKFISMCILDATCNTGIYNYMYELKGNGWKMQEKLVELSNEPSTETGQRLGRWFGIIIEKPMRVKKQGSQGSHQRSANQSTQNLLWI